jgi:hypothetical protein
MDISGLDTVLVAIAAVIIALNQGLKDAARLRPYLPGWVKSTRWNYVPAVLVTMAACVFIYNEVLHKGVTAPVATASTRAVVSAAPETRPIVPLSREQRRTPRDATKSVSEQPTASSTIPTDAPAAAEANSTDLPLDAFSAALKGTSGTVTLRWSHGCSACEAAFLALKSRFEAQQWHVYQTDAPILLGLTGLSVLHGTPHFVLRCSSFASEKKTLMYVLSTAKFDFDVSDGSSLSDSGCEIAVID